MSDRKKDKNGTPVNIGTSNKQKLEQYAIAFIKSYGKKDSLKTLAELLSWDLHITARTALDSYVMPMYQHDIIIAENANRYCFNKDKKDLLLSDLEIDKILDDKKKMEK